ncbi:hypothetical protein NIES2119_24890 [[Phormidium ambiguum] IAM M-71]|uniref:SH3b domain-containing protein n=1 Tax=[Phormidium ambiguum] IAM M-71 TaxID=454136 RepID=A0A1U7I8U2_9CYAN|nr:hypothetical protein [Phormidium ambiguum]OKH32820.1 hypothetical protein NIES2119_24890 [Phormidium ambiguum IAM M-71]
MSAWKNFVATVSLVSLSALGSLGFGIKPSTAATQYFQHCETAQTSFINNDVTYNYQPVANYQQVSSRVSCSRVVTNGGRLHIRRSPGGQLIGYAYNGGYVRVIPNSYRHGWVRLSTGGYVHTRYLRPCPRSVAG